MKQESDASKQPGQQPSGYPQQNPGQQPYSEPKPPTTEEECKEPEPETPTEPCPPFPPPQDLCGPNVACYGPPSGVMILARTYAKSPRVSLGGISLKGLLGIECKEPDPCSGQTGNVPCKACEGLIDDPAEDGKKICFEPCYEIDLQGACDAVGLQTNLEDQRNALPHKSIRRPL